MALRPVEIFAALVHRVVLAKRLDQWQVHRVSILGLAAASK
jgi:hypothetical protein